MRQRHEKGPLAFIQRRPTYNDNFPYPDSCLSTHEDLRPPRSRIPVDAGIGLPSVDIVLWSRRRQRT